MRNMVEKIVLACLAVLGAVGIIFLCVSPHFLHAREDAVMLFAYSTNLARTGVISFYAGGPRAEGATDFLWMLLLAGAAKVHIDVYYFANFLSAVSLLGLATILLRIARQQTHLLLIFAMSGLFLLTPQTWAAVGGFSVFPFAALMTLFVWLLLDRRMVGASVAALATCLLRPDGVVFVVPLLLMFTIGVSNQARAWKVISGLFVLPGVLYFLWRWHYFGEFLPLPFLVKSDTQHVFGYFDRQSVIESEGPLAFGVTSILLVCGTALKRRDNLKLIIGLLIIPTLFYFHMRLDQDIALRFYFYPILAFGILVAQNWATVRRKPKYIMPTCLLIWVLCLAHPFWSWYRLATRYIPYPSAEISRELSELPIRGTVIASEAGYVPFYSNWISYDPWGLNTPLFAHRLLQPGDVVALHPDLVVLRREDGSPCVFDPSWAIPYTVRTWKDMERNLIAGVHQEHYDLYLEHGPRRENAASLVCWLVNRESVEKDAVEALLDKHHFDHPAVQ